MLEDDARPQATACTAAVESMWQRICYKVSTLCNVKRGPVRLTTIHSKLTPANIQALAGLYHDVKPLMYACLPALCLQTHEVLYSLQSYRQNIITASDDVLGMPDKLMLLFGPATFPQ